MIAGIDISLDQGVITLGDARTLKQQGKRFVIIRAAEGMGGIDPRFLANVAVFTAIGIPIGPYFPIHPDLDPVAQAESHFALCKALGSMPGSLAPWTDIELTRGKTPAEVLAVTIAYTQRVLELWGRRATVYTYPYFDHTELSKAAGDDSPLALTNLAMAAYQANPPAAPEPWGSVMFWQNTGGQAEPGIEVYHLPNGCPCDTDFFMGDEDAFAKALDPAA